MLTAIADQKASSFHSRPLLLGLITIMTAANDSAGDVHFELTAAYIAHNEPAPEPLTELNTLLLKSQQNDCFTDAHADKVRVN